MILHSDRLVNTVNGVWTLLCVFNYGSRGAPMWMSTIVRLMPPSLVSSWEMAPTHGRDLYCCYCRSTVTYDDDAVRMHAIEFLYLDTWQECKIGLRVASNVCFYVPTTTRSAFPFGGCCSSPIGDHNDRLKCVRLDVCDNDTIIIRLCRLDVSASFKDHTNSWDSNPIITGGNDHVSCN